MVRPNRQADTRSCSVNLLDLNLWVAGNDALVRAIDEQVEILQHDCAQERGFALGFHHRTESAVPAKQFDIDPVGNGAQYGPAIGVADLDSVTRGQTERFDDLRRQNEFSGSRVDNRANGLTAHFVL